MVQCWATVSYVVPTLSFYMFYFWFNVAPTLNQHWVNVSCLLGSNFRLILFLVTEAFIKVSFIAPKPSKEKLYKWSSEPYTKYVCLLATSGVLLAPVWYALAWKSESPVLQPCSVYAAGVLSVMLIGSGAMSCSSPNERKSSHGLLSWWHEQSGSGGLTTACIVENYTPRI